MKPISINEVTCHACRMPATLDDQQLCGLCRLRQPAAKRTALVASVARAIRGGLSVFKDRGRSTTTRRERA